jgi:hypothetical protein
MKKEASFIGSLLLFLVMQLFSGNPNMSIKRLRMFCAHILVPNKVLAVSHYTHNFGLLL